MTAPHLHDSRTCKSAVPSHVGADLFLSRFCCQAFHDSKLCELFGRRGLADNGSTESTVFLGSGRSCWDSGGGAQQRPSRRPWRRLGVTQEGAQNRILLCKGYPSDSQRVSSAVQTKMTNDAGGRFASTTHLELASFHADLGASRLWCCRQRWSRQCRSRGVQRRPLRQPAWTCAWAKHWRQSGAATVATLPGGTKTRLWQACSLGDIVPSGCSTSCRPIQERI